MNSAINCSDPVASSSSMILPTMDSSPMTSEFNNVYYKIYLN